mmetsp:Transcript_20045/g.57430  ORF Transcript_20045/g.57430 Transcript_20045/m.57430 type:complete len:146 (-) Transcript_20045:7-444(-)
MQVELDAEIQKLRADIAKASTASPRSLPKIAKLGAAIKMSSDLERLRRETQATKTDEPWRAFTPSDLKPDRCLARVERDRFGLAGGQCGKLKVMGKDYCDHHLAEDSRQLGRVDGPIPEEKMQLLERPVPRRATAMTHDGSVADA